MEIVLNPIDPCLKVSMEKSGPTWLLETRQKAMAVTLLLTARRITMLVNRVAG